MHFPVFSSFNYASVHTMQQTYSLCDDILTKVVTTESLMSIHCCAALQKTMTSTPIYVFAAGVYIVTDNLFSLRKKNTYYVHISFPRVQSVVESIKLLSSPCHHSVFLFFILLSLLSLSSFLATVSHPPSPSLPNSPSVQWQGTGSRHWLDFHTVPSTERHIKLIRVNKLRRCLAEQGSHRLSVGWLWWYRWACNLWSGSRGDG